MDNTSKIIWYLRLVAKQPIQIDGREEWMDIKTLGVSPTLFHTDECEVCGDCCCVAEDNVYTQFEYDKIMNMTDEEFRAEGYIFGPEGFDPVYLNRLKPKLYAEPHTVNGKQINIYIAPLEKVELTCTHCPPRKEGHLYPRCTWTRRDPDGLTKCSIHPVRSITCDMPHVRFIYQKGKNLSIGIVAYGRNWAMGCPIQFHPPKDEEEWQRNKDNVLRKLKHLNQNGLDMNVETWLPEIIDYIENIPYENYEMYLGRHVVDTQTNTITKVSDVKISEPKARSTTTPIKRIHTTSKKLFDV